MTDIYIADNSCDENINPKVSEVYHHLNQAGAPLAMAYVPYQHWECPYDLCHALKTGTVFPSLNKPFCGKGGACR